MITSVGAFERFDDTFSVASPNSGWFFVQAGPYTANDGVMTTQPHGGLQIVPAGRNPVTGDPAFGISLPHESSGGVPATNDHAKWLAYMQHASSAGFPGFDAIEGVELSGTARLGGRTYGTDRHPFGDLVPDPQTDLRLSAFAMTTIDVETFMVFDFLFTNRQVYAFYERLPFARSAAHPYAAFSYAVPVKARSEHDLHEASIAYDRAAGVVRWMLDGVEVFRVTRVGHRLESRAHLLIDLGGAEESVRLRQLDFGMGLFTLLDGATADRPGLVRLSDSLRYYAPDRGEPHALSFADEESRLESRLFGQGAELRIADYTVGYVPALGRAHRPDQVAAPALV